MAWPHPNTEFTDNYSTTCLLQYHNLFLSHSVLTKHLLPALDLRSAFLMPKPENFTRFHNETNCVRPKKTATFPPLLAVSLTVLTLNVHPINKMFYTSISVHWNEASLCLAQQCAKKEICGMSCKGNFGSSEDSDGTRAPAHSSRWQSLVSPYMQILTETCLSSLQGGGRWGWEQDST